MAAAVGVGVVVLTGLTDVSAEEVSALLLAYAALPEPVRHWTAALLQRLVLQGSAASAPSATRFPDLAREVPHTSKAGSSPRRHGRALIRSKGTPR